jgi:hypothetical protein
MDMLHVQGTFQSCMTKLHSFCFSMLHFRAMCTVHSACPYCISAACSCCISLLNVCLHTHVKAASYVLAECLWTVSCMSLLHVHDAYLCCMSMTHVYGACPRCMSMPHVHDACPWRISMLHVLATLVIAEYLPSFHYPTPSLPAVWSVPVGTNYYKQGHILFFNSSEAERLCHFPETYSHTIDDTKLERSRIKKCSKAKKSFCKG